MFSWKTKGHFALEQKLPQKEALGAISHVIGKTTKKPPDALSQAREADIPQKYQNIWYLKEASSGGVAAIEVFSQELFRIFELGPKTRFVINDAYDQAGPCYVASKQIVNSTPLPAEDKITWNEQQYWNRQIKGGIYTGLGELAVISRYLNEVDLKFGNIVFDKQGQVNKFDGDWCLAIFRDWFWADDTITAEQIDQLPKPGHKVHNWLNYVVNGEINKHPFFDSDLPSNPRIQAERNYALLKILILSEEFIKQLIIVYLGYGLFLQQRIYNYLIQRRKLFEKAAFENASFRLYLQSSDSKKQLQNYLGYLKSFMTTDKNYLFQAMVKPEEQILKQYEALRKRVCAIPSLSTPLEEKPTLRKVKTERNPLSSLAPASPEKRMDRLSLAITPVAERSPISKSMLLATLPRLHPLGKNIPFWKKRATQTALFGLALSLVGAAVFIVLRALDVLVCGLSLPATIPLSIGVCGITGTGVGYAIGKLCFNKPSAQAVNAHLPDPETDQDAMLLRNLGRASEQMTASHTKRKGGHDYESPQSTSLPRADAPHQNSRRLIS